MSKLNEEKLKTTITVFKKGERQKRTILSQKEDIFTFRHNIIGNILDDNSHKADIIFDTLKPYEKQVDEFEFKYNLKKVNSVSISHSMIYIDEPYYPFEHKIDRDGFEIFNTHVDRVVTLECYTYDDKIIRFDFQGYIDASGGFDTFFNYDIEDYCTYSTINETQTLWLIDKIKEEEDGIIELSGSPLYENPKTNFSENSGLIPQGDFPYMIEFFSWDLIDPTQDEYQGCFSEHDLNGTYIRDVMKLIEKIEARAEELRKKYSNKGVKVTVNDFNEGCQYGMAIYVWIPYQ